MDPPADHALPDGQDAPAQKHRSDLPLGLLAVLVGALVIVVGCFLPYLNPRDAGVELQGNLLASALDGWLFVAGAITVAALALSAWWRGDVRWWAIAACGGLLLLATWGELRYVGSRPIEVYEFGRWIALEATPAAGLYALLVGSLLVLGGGLLLHGVEPARPAHSAPAAAEGAPAPAPPVAGPARPAAEPADPFAPERPASLWRRPENDPPRDRF